MRPPRRSRPRRSARQRDGCERDARRLRQAPALGAGHWVAHLTHRTVGGDHEDRDLSARIGDGQMGALPVTRHEWHGDRHQ